MTSTTATQAPPRRRLEVEVWLAIGGLLTFLLVPLHLKTIYSGLPAHPLFLHVPVILIPLAATAALVLVARPRLVAQHGPWIGAVTVVALATTNLTMGAGSALRDALHLGAGSRGFGGAAGPAALVARHAHAASILRLLVIAFTAVFIIVVALYRREDGSSTGIPIADGILTRARRVAPSLAPLRVLLAVLALACMYFVFLTGDLGAKAAWEGRLGGAGAGFPRGGTLPPGFKLPAGGAGAAGGGAASGGAASGGAASGGAASGGAPASGGG